jgi:hypothetical protein
MEKASHLNLRSMQTPEMEQVYNYRLISCSRIGRRMEKASHLNLRSM